MGASTLPRETLEKRYLALLAMDYDERYAFKINELKATISELREDVRIFKNEKDKIEVSRKKWKDKYINYREQIRAIK